MGIIKKITGDEVKKRLGFDLPVPHVDPVQPELQLQLLGDTQDPWPLHPYLQIAVKIHVT